VFLVPVGGDDQGPDPGSFGAPVASFISALRRPRSPVRVHEPRVTTVQQRTGRGGLKDDPAQRERARGSPGDCVGVVGPTRATRLAVRRRGEDPDREGICSLVQRSAFCPKRRTPKMFPRSLSSPTLTLQVIAVAAPLTSPPQAGRRRSGYSFSGRY
jgi:hypothetical protein